MLFRRSNSTYVLFRDNLPKSSVDISINVLTHCCRQLFGVWIIRKVKFCPDDKMYDPLINAVWPIVVQDLDVPCGETMRLGSR